MDASYIVLKNPYGGFGLRAKTVNSAYARIARVLQTMATDILLTEAVLRITDPCTRELAEAIAGEPLDGSCASGTRHRLQVSFDDLVARQGHAPGETTDKALARFGAPCEFGYDQLTKGHFAANWGWKRTRATDNEAAEWLAFSNEHNSVLGEYQPEVQLRMSWTFRLVTPTGSPPPSAELPLSLIMANLSVRWSSAFLEPVFPFAEASPEFRVAFDEFRQALGLRIPAGAVRLDSPTKNGSRKLRKLASWP